MSGRHEATDSDTGGLNETVLEELRSAVGGNVIVPGDETYDYARAVWNGMIERRPAVIVGCRGADDVIAAVAFAGEHHLPVAIRGGGHNVAGHAVCDDGVMIDLSEMRSVQVDPERRRAWSTPHASPNRRCDATDVGVHRRSRLTQAGDIVFTLDRPRPTL